MRVVLVSHGRGGGMFIGCMCAVHQFCVIGVHVMVGGCSGVAQDVPPFVIAQGNHASPVGVNTTGLKRRGFSKEAIQAIRNAYKLLYRSGKTLDQAKPEIAEIATAHAEVKPSYDFLDRSTRGLFGEESHTCLCLLAWRNQFSRKKQEAAKAQPHQSLDRLPAHAFLHGLG